jgi:hypothetical protein
VVLVLSAPLCGLVRLGCCSPTCVVSLASNEGNYARENPGVPHGYYSGALLDAIDTCGAVVPVMDLLRQVSERVSTLTDGKQRPSTIGAVGSDAFFVDTYGNRRVPGPNPLGVTVCTVVEKPLEVLRAQVRERERDGAASSDSRILVASHCPQNKKCERCGGVSMYLQIALHASELHYYLEPAALVGELPLNVASALEYVTKTEAGSPKADYVALCDVADRFLASGRQLLLLLGEAGSGKSAFLWQLCKRLLSAAPPGLLHQPVSRMPSAVKPLYLPVYVELKRCRADGLAGLLDRALRSAGLTPEAGQALRGQDTSAPMVRVVLLADGFDELQGDASAVRDFLNTVCGGWDPALLAVIATSRESRVGGRTRERDMFGGKYDRALLLPFTKKLVSACMAAQHVLLVVDSATMAS